MNETVFPEYNLGRLADAVTGNYPQAPQRSTFQRIIRKPLTWVLVGVAILGTAVAIMVAGRPGAVTPASILAGDGYSASITFNHQQLVQAMNSDGGGSSDLNPGDYFTTAAAGVNGGNEEIVLGVTDQGKSLEGLLVPVLNNQPGVHARTVDGGSYIVVSGSGSALGGFASNSGGTTIA
jgi:hypothetical protein